LAGHLSDEPGYFSFGQGSVCFGRSSAGSPARVLGNGLVDVSQHVSSDGSVLRLPFDPSETVDNLRRERYRLNGCADDRTILSSKAIRKAYYCFRPLLPVSVRKYAQRLSLRNWRALTFPAWPVDTTVERILERVLLLAMIDNRTRLFPVSYPRRIFDRGLEKANRSDHGKTRFGEFHCPPGLHHRREGVGRVQGPPRLRCAVARGTKYMGCPSRRRQPLVARAEPNETGTWGRWPVAHRRTRPRTGTNSLRQH